MAMVLPDGRYLVLSARAVGVDDLAWQVLIDGKPQPEDGPLSFLTLWHAAKWCIEHLGVNPAEGYDLDAEIEKDAERRAKNPEQRRLL